MDIRIMQQKRIKDMHANVPAAKKNHWQICWKLDTHSWRDFWPGQENPLDSPHKGDTVGRWFMAHIYLQYIGLHTTI